MTATGFVILSCYLVLTLLVVLTHIKYGMKRPTQYIKFAIRLSMLFIAVFLLKKEYKQLMIIFAILFTVISDFFFVLLNAFNPKVPNRKVYGMLGFVASYILLILAFGRGLEVDYTSVIVFLSLFLVVISLVFLLGNYAKRMELIVAVMLGLVLCTAVTAMALSFDAKTVLAGIMLFISDIAVAFSLFHPIYKRTINWKENIIWINYIIGWTLIILTVWQ